MPIPNPRKDEEEQEFISRCIKFLKSEDPDADIKQVTAICYQTWRDRNKESMDETQYKKDEDGDFIIAENIPFLFNTQINIVKEEENKPGA